MKRTVLAGLLGVLAFTTAATRVVTSHGATIWPTGSISHIKLCSRKLPDRIDGTWQPRWRDIAKAEQALPDAVRAWRIHRESSYFLRPAQFENSDWRSRYSRNYFGIVRNKHPLLYVDFAPRPERDGFTVCDGGSFYFGVEYDPSTRTILNLSTNGIG